MARPSNRTPSHTARARITRFLPAAVAFLAAGCPEPGSLENPQDFPTNLPACVVGTFRNHCALSGCHTGRVPAADLDLGSPRVTERLLDVPSTHLDIDLDGIPPECPTGDLLVNTRSPGESWMLKKIREEQGACGDPMPAIPTGFGDEEKACLESWILSLQSDAGAGGTGGADAGDADVPDANDASAAGGDG
jgi:hypothetical protein